MSKKYIAKMDNIFFKSKIYGKGDTVLVDDKEEMPEGRWQLFSEYEKEQEDLRKAADPSLSNAEKDKRIENLAEEIVDLKRENKRLMAELKKAKETKEDK